MKNKTPTRKKSSKTNGKSRQPLKLVHETINNGLAPLEVGPEFALNLGFVN
jgi:hypothetical protein